MMLATAAVLSDLSPPVLLSFPFLRFVFTFPNVEISRSHLFPYMHMYMYVYDKDLIHLDISVSFRHFVIVGLLFGGPQLPSNLRESLAKAILAPFWSSLCRSRSVQQCLRVSCG